ncbi:MAG TPA: AAA family ATPase, partial [Chitinophagales bacterium]|nr:AAA family ATPase [Chitinophagales bacterium]
MIDRISINNLFSFGQTDIRLCRDVNLLIGINGSGKSNFLKLLSLLQQGIGGVGLKKYIFDYLGGLDNLLTKNNVSETPDARLQITLMPEELNRHTNGFEFLNPLTYAITLVKTPGLTNFYVRETIANRQGVVYLEVQNGTGFLLEQPDDTIDKSGKRIHYTDFDPQELALASVNDTNRYP